MAIDEKAVSAFVRRFQDSNPVYGTRDIREALEAYEAAREPGPLQVTHKEAVAISRRLAGAEPRPKGMPHHDVVLIVINEVLAQRPPASAPLVDEPGPVVTPTRDARDWRVAIESALGLEPDAENHTPEWAHDVVQKIREIGNRQPEQQAGRAEREKAVVAALACTCKHGTPGWQCWHRDARDIVLKALHGGHVAGKEGT